jgi:hypothetical protein
MTKRFHTASADTERGLSGTQIERLLQEIEVTDTSPGITKWKRLFNALAEPQNRHQMGRAPFPLLALGYSPGLPAPLGCLRQRAQQAHLRQGLGCVVPGEAPGHFAFQLVREAACVFLPAQGPLPPFASLGHQFIVL